MAPAVREAAAGTDRWSARRAGTESKSLAAGAFAVFVAIAAWALIFHLGRYFWFNGDEWDFLSQRNGGNVGDLLRAHNEHPSLLPIVVYRVLWHGFGLRSYRPYQIPVITLHLGAAVLLRAIMRRCGVNPWIASAAAAMFVLFGPGEENIIWAFQIGFTGSLTFGLSQLLLADHDGQIDRRDWFALAMGGLGLLCSGFTPITTAVVAVVVFVRRGARPALLQSVPLAVLYGTWWIAIGPQLIKDPYGRPTNAGAILHFVVVGASATFVDLGGGNRIMGALLGLALIVGLVVAWRPLPRGERLQRAIMPISLLAGGLAFLLVSGFGRWWIGPNDGDSSRYVHLVAAFSLPAIAVAVDALVRAWRAAASFAVPVAVVVLVSGIPHNIGQFDTLPPFNGPYFAARRELIAALARSPYITQVPLSTRPDPLWSSFDDRWLLDALHSGRLPTLRNPKAADDPSFRLRFGLAVIDAPVPVGTACSVIRKPIDLSLRKGDELGVKVGPWTHPKDGWFFKQSYTMQLLLHDKPVGGALLVHPDDGHLLRAQLDHLDVRFALAPGTESFILCR